MKLKLNEKGQAAVKMIDKYYDEIETYFEEVV